MYLADADAPRDVFDGKSIALLALQQPHAHIDGMAARIRPSPAAFLAQTKQDLIRQGTDAPKAYFSLLADSI
jgi:hypothetical protein